MAEDVLRYMDENDIEQATVAGQSIGGKIAMTLGCLHPDRVDGVISIDSPPVNTNYFPHLNEATLRLLDMAESLDLEGKTYSEAWQYILGTLKSEMAVASAFALCLDKSSQTEARWQMNLPAILENTDNLFDFEKQGEYYGPFLSLVGQNSSQSEIECDKDFYADCFPTV